MKSTSSYVDLTLSDQDSDIEEGYFDTRALDRSPLLGGLPELPGAIRTGYNTPVLDQLMDDFALDSSTDASLCSTSAFGDREPSQWMPADLDPATCLDGCSATINPQCFMVTAHDSVCPNNTSVSQSQSQYESESDDTNTIYSYNNNNNINNNLNDNNNNPIINNQSNIHNNNQSNNDYNNNVSNNASSIFNKDTSSQAWSSDVINALLVQRLDLEDNFSSLRVSDTELYDACLNQALLSLVSGIDSEVNVINKLVDKHGLDYIKTKSPNTLLIMIKIISSFMKYLI